MPQGEWMKSEVLCSNGTTPMVGSTAHPRPWVDVLQGKDHTRCAPNTYQGHSSYLGGSDSPTECCKNPTYGKSHGANAQSGTRAVNRTQALRSRSILVIRSVHRRRWTSSTMRTSCVVNVPPR